MRWQIQSIGFDIPLEDDDDIVDNLKQNAELIQQYINTEWTGEQLDAVQSIQNESAHLISSIIFKAIQ